MTTVIKSGSDGNTARVDDKARLHTFSVVQPQNVNSGREGQTFFIRSPILNLTSESESFILFGKNEDSVSWIIEELTTLTGVSAGGSGELSSRYVINPSGGTLLSSGSEVTPINLNIGHPQQLGSKVLSGVEGSTATGGIPIEPSMIVSDQSEKKFTGSPIVIPTGVSFAFSITPPTGNTGMNVQLDIVLFRDVEI